MAINLNYYAQQNSANSQPAAQKQKLPWSTKDKVSMVALPAICGGITMLAGLWKAEGFKQKIAHFSKCIEFESIRLKNHKSSNYATPSSVKLMEGTFQQTAKGLEKAIAWQRELLSKMPRKVALTTAIATGIGIAIGLVCKEFSDKKEIKKAQQKAVK